MGSKPWKWLPYLEHRAFPKKGWVDLSAEQQEWLQALPVVRVCDARAVKYGDFMKWAEATASKRGLTRSEKCIQREIGRPERLLIEVDFTKPSKLLQAEFIKLLKELGYKEKKRGAKVASIENTPTARRFFFDALSIRINKELGRSGEALLKDSAGNYISSGDTYTKGEGKVSYFRPGQSYRALEKYLGSLREELAEGCGETALLKMQNERSHRISGFKAALRECRSNTGPGKQ